MSHRTTDLRYTLPHEAETALDTAVFVSDSSWAAVAALAFPFFLDCVEVCSLFPPCPSFLRFADVHVVSLLLATAADVCFPVTIIWLMSWHWAAVALVVGLF